MVQNLDLNYGLVEEMLLSFLRRETGKFAFTSVVLGLSGGIDSAVVCELAVRALGASNVLAILMPYETSSSASLEHASLMVQKLGISAETIAITSVAHAFFASIPNNQLLRRGNVMARTRMMYLYDISARDGRLGIGN